MAQPLVNGTQHAWASIQVNILGRTLTGITSIDYGHDRAIEDHHGAGDEPVARGLGNKVYKKVMLEVFQFEAVALQVAAGGDFTTVPAFDIPVLYKAEAGTPQVVDVLQNCQFLNNNRSLKSGDTKSLVKLELICAGIKYHSV